MGQLSRRIVKGGYAGTSGEPLFNNNLAPVNAFNNPMLLGITDNYQDAGSAAGRLHLVIGRGIPVQILRELDVKVDDGVPDTGVLRDRASTSVFAGANNWGGSDACWCNTTRMSIYDVASNSPDCNGVFISAR